MPGIVGLQTRMPRGWAEQHLKLMVNSVQHEQFYVVGTWIDESMGLYVGWAARKNFLPDGMPFRNNRGDLTLIFSGEEFSNRNTERYRDETSPSLGLSAVRYLIEAAETDPSFPANLNGRFHGLLADHKRGSITLFNDRFGMHRLHVHQAKEAVYFANEAKAILAVRPELRRIEQRALAEYVTCGCVLENRTLFEGIEILPGASTWVLKHGSVETRTSYFSPEEWEAQEPLEAEVYYHQLREAFNSTLPRYFKSKEPIGISLTGGLDTRMILAWYKPGAESRPCYTFGGPYRDCQDVVVARQVARVCGQPHEVVKVGEEFLSQFHHYAERAVYLTDGCVDVRRASDLYLNERARAIAPIRMTGNYGSEVLRGVRAFKPTSPMPGLFHHDLLAQLSRANETYHSLVRAHPVSFAVFKQAPWYHYGLLALEETQVSLRSPYLDNDIVRTVYRAPRSLFASHDFCLRLIADGNPELRKIPTDRGVGRMGLFGLWLQKLEEGLAKAEYAYDYGMPQWAARIDHVLSPLHLERLFLGRQKFTHYRVWYRDELASYVRDMLLDERTLARPYLQRGQLEAMVHGHLKGNRNYCNEIHTVLSLELLHRLFVDNS